MTHFRTNERSSHTGSEYRGKMLSLLMGTSMVPYWRWGTDPVVAAISRCMSKGQDKKGLSTAGQLLIEPRGPVSVCVGVGVCVCVCVCTCSRWQYHDGQWLAGGLLWWWALGPNLTANFFTHCTRRSNARNQSIRPTEAIPENPIHHLAVSVQSIPRQPSPAVQRMALQHDSHMLYKQEEQLPPARRL